MEPVGEMSSDSALPLLGYAPRPKRRRVRRAILSLLVVCLLLAGWWLRKPIWARLVLIHLERTAMAYTAPPDLVVYEDDPTQAAQLLAGLNGYRALRPRLTDALAPTSSLPAAFYPAVADRYPGAYPYVFLHGLNKPSGPTRLLAAFISFDELSRDGRLLKVTGLAIEPTPLLGTRKELGRGGFLLQLGSGDRLRLFAGQCDSIDSSCFTIRYQLNDNHGAIGGRLKDDGNIEMTVIEGPMTLREKW